MQPPGSTPTRAMLAAAMAAFLVVAGCSQGSGGTPSGATDQTATTHAKAQTPAPAGADTGGPKPLGRGVKSSRPVPDVVGKRIEAACRALSSAGHAGEVSYVRRARGVEPGRVLDQDIEPGTNKGTSMLVYLTVSGPFREKELSPDTFCANPQENVDDAPPRAESQ